MFIRPEVENVSIKTEFSSPQQGNFVLNISGSGTIKTYFAKVIGHSEMSFGSKSEVLWGIKKLNLALALDNTGSMNSNGKMTALKTAAHNLSTRSRTPRRQPGDIKVSIVPFAVDVNAGTRMSMRPGSIGKIGKPPTAIAARRRIIRRAAATTTAAPGRRRTTASGTAASTIATRTTT